MLIKNKKQFYELFEKGFFGNKALTWNSYKELLESDWRGDVCIRGKGIPRTDVKYNIPFEKVKEEIKLLKSKGIPEGILRFNQSMPDSALVIQGEVIDYIRGFELTYTNAKKPMNEGFKEDTKFAFGLMAKMILRLSMDPSSFSDLTALLEVYPESAVEFSTYSVCVGDIPRRNTVFWEVRNY